jgi:hypothetical protein
MCFTRATKTDKIKWQTDHIISLQEKLFEAKKDLMDLEKNE